VLRDANSTRSNRSAWHIAFLDRVKMNTNALSFCFKIVRENCPSRDAQVTCSPSDCGGSGAFQRGSGVLQRGSGYFIRGTEAMRASKKRARLQNSGRVGAAGRRSRLACSVRSNDRRRCAASVKRCDEPSADIVLRPSAAVHPRRAVYG